MSSRKKLLNITIIIGILTVWLLGSLFHFVYGWSGNNTLVGLFFPTNESTWEHMKLVFLPMNLYAIYTWYALKDRYNAAGFAIFLGVIVGTWAIPFLYYTYMGILGFSKMWLDISTFFIGPDEKLYVVFAYGNNNFTSEMDIIIIYGLLF